MSFVTKDNTEDIYPLSPAQQGILFHSLYDESTPVYFEQFAFTINGPLDVENFKIAWKHLIDSTPVFRTVFRWSKSDKPVQIVLKRLPVDLEVHDLTPLSELEQYSKINNFFEIDKRQPFNMEEGPLIRLNLFILDKEKVHFIWSYHHIIIDGWSLPIVLRDLFDIYMVLIKKGSLYRPSHRSYKDYIAWLAQQDKDAALAFWKQQGGDFTAPTPLPFDRRPHQASYSEIMEEKLIIPEDMTSRLQAFARKQRVTLNTLIQSVWAILLSYYSNQDDVVFGSTVSGRPADLKGSENMVGLFINTLPLRVKLNKDMGVSEFLKDVQKISISIREYEYSFLPEIKACSRVPKNQNLFDSIVVFENYPIDSFNIDVGSGFGISDISASEMTNFALTTVIAPGSSISIRIQYSKALFDGKTIQRMISHIHNILTNIIDNPEQKVSEIDILTQEEKDQILISFNDTQAQYSLDRCIYQIIEDQVLKSPDNIAVTFKEKALTYRELNEKSNQLAQYLRRHGVGKETMVGLMLDRSLEMMIALLGILKAGGAYVPLGTEYPLSRLEYILDDTQISIVLSQEKLAGKLPDRPVKVICLDSGWSDIAKEDVSNLDPISSPDNLAYVIYTSGSTGVPKGVACIHKGICNRLMWMQDAYCLKYDDCILQKTPYTFDVSGWEFFWALMYGARIHFLNPGGEKDPIHIMEVIRDQKITTMHFVPSMLGAFLQVLDDNTNGYLTSLRRVICSGEALLSEHRDTFFRHLDCELHNLYGPTEASIDVTYYACRPGDRNNIIPIGRPIANTQIYILNRYMQPVPVEVPGEIYLSGVGLARGYVNKPEKTAQAFVPSPFHENGRLYKTGDLGRWLPDGNIEYLGRIDHQVKIRGNRIELGEIEAVLARYEGIKDCVVVDRDDGGSKYLVGYYVAGKDVGVSRLRDFLKESLPEYMVPSRFMRLENLPLTPNGKVDRNALPEPEGLRPDIESEYVAPRDEVEQVIVDTWKDVLGLDRVGIYDNFFDLGGDSIISLQVVNRLKKKGFGIQPKDIFEYQSIAELAPMVGRETVLKVNQSTVYGTSPLAPIQRWFFEQDLKNYNHFNQSVMFRTKIGLDAGALKKALQALIDHHDVLRVRFRNEDSTYIQEFKPLGEDASLVVKDVSSDEELKAEADKLQGSLDILKGPVFRVGLYHMGGNDYLVLVAHHLAIDGVSWRILLEDLFTGYSYALGSKDIALPDKTTSFKDWSMLLEEYAKRDDVIEEASYWKDVLPDSILDIPIDHDLGANDIASCDVVRIELSEEETSSLLRDAHKAYNTEVNDLLLTALMRTLQDCTGRSDVVFDLEAHGREDVIDGVDISRTVGWFTTLYPVNLAIDRGEDIGTHIKYVKERLHTIPHKGFNFCVLKYIGDGLKVDKSLFFNIKPQVCFNYLGQITQASIGDGIRFTEQIKTIPADPQNTREHLIDINCKVVDSRLHIDFLYSKNKHLDSTIRALAQRFKGELEDIVHFCMGPEHEGYTPSDFALNDISQDQLDELLDEIQDI